MFNQFVMIFAFLAFAVPVLAGKINMDARMDSVSYTPNDAVGKSTYSVFQISRLKVDFQGELGTQNLFRVRIDPLNSNQAPTARDKTSKYLDFAFIKHKFNPEFSLTLGKIISGMGGVEASLNTGDIYLRTVAGDEVAAIYYPTGLQAEFVCDLGTIKLNVANVTEDSTTSGNLDQTSNLYGVVWTGQFMDKKFLPNLSYHTETYKTTGASGAEKNKNYVSVGSRFIFNAIELEADYLQNKRSFAPQAAADILLTQTSYLLLRYKFSDVYSGHLKGESTEKTTATSTTADAKSKITGLTAAVEYKPVADENWRMHLAYTQKDTAPDGAITQIEKTVYFGMKILADFL